MCGIGGLILASAGIVKPEWMRVFLEQLEHRGPDDAGWLSLVGGRIRAGKAVPSDVVAEVVLLHRRLSILDLSDAGRQPMGTADGRYWIVFNGEIYNYVELREELEKLGHRFRSRTDTEVLLAAYVQWGIEALQRFVGMFAFAIVDSHARRLLLVRDFFGIKPLYYAYWQDGLAFASEISVLLELPGVDRSVNAQALYDYLHSGITDHGGETLFAQVRRLPAAHYCEISLDSPFEATPVRYWSIDQTEQIEWSMNAAATRMRDLFLESVRLHLRSDVPIGAALSGGIDSSAIVMAMRHLDQTVDIHTFSYIADDPVIGEERWVDQVGQAAGATIHKVRPTPHELATDLDELIRIQEEPFGSTSIYAQSRVFKLAREAGVKVMLDGQGADELLAGYPDYRLAGMASLLRRGKWGDAWCLSRAGHASMRESLCGMLPRALARSTPPFLQTWLRRGLRSTAPPTWMNERWFSDRDARPRQFHHAHGKQLLKNELYLTLTETSLPQLLHYEDRNSMAVSIESRVPFLTPSLAKFVFTLPESCILTTEGTTKAVFRQAMRGLVPDAVLDRRDKLGFPTPERHWLLSVRAWVERILSSDAAQDLSVLHAGALQRTWSEIAHGTQPYDSSMWRCLNLILWAKKFRVTTA